VPRSWSGACTRPARSCGSTDELPRHRVGLLGRRGSWWSASIPPGAAHHTKPCVRNAVFECSILAFAPAGTHEAILGEITALPTGNFRVVVYFDRIGGAANLQQGSYNSTRRRRRLGMFV
jgi:hypothetical protein